MSKKAFARLTRIVTGTFGAGKDDAFSLEASLTRFEKFIHFWSLVWQSFVRNRCPVRASALSYTTLLALIPMLAVAMSVSSVFLKSKGEEQIERFIQGFVDNIVPAAPVVDVYGQVTPGTVEPPASHAVTVGETNSSDNVAEMANTNALPSDAIVAVARAKKSVAKEAAVYIHGFVAKTYSGTLGVTGMIFLVLTAILTLTRVEETFNDIWGVTRGRDWWSRITNYFTTIALGPSLLIAAIGMMSGPYFQKTRSLLGEVTFLEPLISSYLPVCVICLTFAVFYKLVPNTKVDFSAALVGGTLAGVSWHLYNQLGFLLASRALSVSAIYGGLALIPLLMGGLYVVWLTVLFGAQVAYAFQNRASYLQEKLADNVNQRGREFVALRLMTCIGQRFQHGLPAVTVREISGELGIPGKLAQQVLHTLLAARLVVEVTGRETGYSPARPLETINTHHLLLAMRATQGQELVTRDEPVRAEVLGEFARIQAAEKAAAASVTMLALVNRAHASLELAPPAALKGKIQAAAMLVTTLTAAGLTEETSTPLAEITTQPASVEVVPDVEFNRDNKRELAGEIATLKSVSSANISSAAPTATSASHDHESFPL